MRDQCKESIYQNVINDGVETAFNFGRNYLIPHFIYCSDIVAIDIQKLIRMFLTSMFKYDIKFSLLTRLDMIRHHLITKEKSIQAYKGKLKNEPPWDNYNGSLNDDLELFADRLHFRAEPKIGPKGEFVRSFFLPKLTTKELKLVNEKNPEYMHTLVYHYSFPGTLTFSADVPPDEMEKSESKDKYLHSSCSRVTLLLNVYEHIGPRCCCNIV